MSLSPRSWAGTILLLEDVGDACSAYMHEVMRDLTCRRLQLDALAPRIDRAEVDDLLSLVPMEEPQLTFTRAW